MFYYDQFTSTDSIFVIFRQPWFSPEYFVASFIFAPFSDSDCPANSCCLTAPAKHGCRPLRKHTDAQSCHMRSARCTFVDAVWCLLLPPLKIALTTMNVTAARLLQRFPNADHLPVQVQSHVLRSLDVLNHQLHQLLTLILETARARSTLTSSPAEVMATL